MTPNDAKRIVKQWLEANGKPAYRLTARTISFSDLTRSSSIFVTVHGWHPDPSWNDLKSLAHQNGFCVEA